MLLAGGIGSVVSDSGGEEFGISNIGYAPQLFLDVGFVELTVGVFFSPLFVNSSGVEHEFGNPGPPIALMALDMSLLMRMPVFTLVSGNSIFPLVGVGYDIVLSAIIGDQEIHEPFELSAFRLKFGVGYDIRFHQQMYFRISGLAAYRFPTMFMGNINTSLFDGNGTVRGGWRGTLVFGMGFML